ncbi:hypothetical protein D3Y57_19100 [Sphingomonas paeninsulae]|uniref:LexA repressor DNA-binding domain-containing protein n=1 Tax=Sphingomonas paeninsulae TaxID=2319844 RepID=A0A494TRA0_SPHPE|nr:hypothetical protein [Sphingomonas paeninsulae]AYJ87645.1 hypothetical protein D3Y57_19100 [Sphingomonas paeninsulae]
MTLPIPAHAQTILRILTAAANAGDQCPTNGVLAEAIGALSISAPANAISLLEAIGLITVERGSCRRMVTIVATGKSTAPVVSKIRAYGTSASPKPHNRKRRPLEYAEPVRVDPSRIVDRDPCTYCGTRSDHGCIHNRRAA